MSLTPAFGACCFVVCVALQAHERSLETDILLGLLKKIARKRPELRIIISSATMDAQKFKDFFETNTSSNEMQDTARIVSVQGRQYPVGTYMRGEGGGWPAQ